MGTDGQARKPVALSARLSARYGDWGEELERTIHQGRRSKLSAQTGRRHDRARDVHSRLNGTQLGQETLKLKKAMDGYKFKVLLKDNSLPSWADLSEKDEKLCDIKELPTRANLFKYLIQLGQDGYYVDIFIFSHGWPKKFKASDGTNRSENCSVDYVTNDDIMNELAPAKTGLTHMPIRTVWGTNCYGQTLGEPWRSVGAKTTAGSRYVRFYPNAFGPFIDAWNKGDVSFHDAVAESDTDFGADRCADLPLRRGRPRTEDSG